MIKFGHMKTLILVLLLAASIPAWSGSFDKDIKELDLQIIFIVPRDAIPAMTNPTLLRPDIATLHGQDSDPRAYLTDDDRVLGVVRHGVARAYPLNLGWWHEVINDSLGGGAISVTYCPLTGTGLVFDVTAKDGTQGELGVSGLLLNSNLVLYDRRDDRTLYPQMTYTGLTGEYRDMQLELLPVVETTWEMWKRLYPSTSVPAAGSGLLRYSQRVQDNYGSKIRLYREAENGYPYDGYRTDDLIYFPITTSEPDLSRYTAKDQVLGICQDGVARAFAFRDMPGPTVINDRVGGLDVVVLFDAETRTAIPYDRSVDGRKLSFHRMDGGDDALMVADRETGSRWDLLGRAVAGPLQGASLRQVPAYNSMWFAWSAFWPDTEVWDGEGVIVPTAVTSSAESVRQTDRRQLDLVGLQAFPNPFNASTQIRYHLASADAVRLEVFDSAGQRVRLLHDGPQRRGDHVRQWDGRNDAGLSVASGVYRYRIVVGAEIDINGAVTLIR